MPVIVRDLTKGRDDYIDVWYRYEDKSYTGSVNEDGTSYGSTIVVHLYKFPVVKLTPKGVWLNPYFENRRFVRREAVRRYACPTIEEARTSFVARKRKQASIYLNRHQRAMYAIAAVMTGDAIVKMYDLEDA